MSDWYPDICNQAPVSDRYMFQQTFEILISGYTVIYNNLKINNYSFNSENKPMGILKVYTNYGTFYDNLMGNHIIFNNFAFTNVISYISNHSLFYITTNQSYTSNLQLTFNETSFENISYHGISSILSIASINIINSNFYNMQMTNYFISSFYINSTEVYQQINVSGSYFGSITTGLALFNSSKFYINDSYIYLPYGSIATSSNVKWPDIKVFNLSIRSKETYVSESNTTSLFDYNGIYPYTYQQIQNISIQNLNIVYEYNLYQNCISMSDPVKHGYPKAWFYSISVTCFNPMPLTKTILPLYFTNSSISVVFVDNDDNIITLNDFRQYIAHLYNYTYQNLTSQYIIVQFDYQQLNDRFSPAFINVSHGYIYIDNVIINDFTVCRTFIYSNLVSEIFMDNVVMINSNNETIDPNDLRSSIINVFTDGGNPSNIYISNSIFYGVERVIKLYSSTRTNITCFNCTVFHSNFVLDGFDVNGYLDGIGNITFESCSFTQLGMFNGVASEMVWISPQWTNCWNPPIYIAVRKLVLLSSNFSYLHYGGFLYTMSYNVSDLLIKKNVFKCENTSFYKRIIYSQLKWCGVSGNGYTSPVAMIQLIKHDDHHISTAQIINNYFGKISDQFLPSFPMLYLGLPTTENKNIEYKVQVKACMTGNTFYNYALQLCGVVMTSCFRPEIVDLLLLNNKSDEQCHIGDFGVMNYDLKTDIGTFFVDSNISEIITLYNIGGGFYGSISTFMAVDNVQFIALNGITNITIANISPTKDIQQDTFPLGLMLVDSFNNSDVDILYNAGLDCPIYCNALYHDDQNISIFQTAIRCNTYHTYNLKNVSSVMASNRTHLTNHISATRMLFQTDKYYYPGGILNINYSIMDKYNNIISKDRFMSTYAIEYDVNFSINNLSYVQSIRFEENGTCSICESGFYFGQITMQDVGVTYIMNTDNTNQLIETNSMTFEVTDCPSGYGVSHNGLQCDKCPSGFFNIFESSNKSCCPCFENKNKGIQCNGGNDIILQKNYWVGIKGITQQVVFENDNDTIVSASCAAGYCCSNNKGCMYTYNMKHVQHTQFHSQLCSSYREPNSILCSKCVEGYSEVFLSTTCQKCDKTRYLWLLYPFLYAVFISYYLLILYSTTKSNGNINHKVHHKTSKICMKLFYPFRFIQKHQYVGEMLKIIIMKIIMYYEQCLSNVLLNGSIHISTSSVADFFNLSFYENNSNSSAYFCFVKEMTAKWEILFGFIVIVIIFCIMLLSKIIDKCT
eukprot:428021_1